MGNQISSQSSVKEQKVENLNLTDQNLTHYHFSKFDNNFFKGLFLSGNRFTTLPKNLKHVSIVDLSNNQIDNLLPTQMAESLTSYTSLETLDLSNNQLKDISTHFRNPTIQSFFLAQNRFTSFPTDFLLICPNLKEITFDYNFLPNLSEFHSQILQQLTLSCNCIETIDIDTLNLPKLETLDLSRNKIKTIPNNFSQSFPSLLNLDLSDNLINELPEIVVIQDTNIPGNDISSPTNLTNGQPQDESNTTQANVEDKTGYVFPKTLQKLKLMNNFLTTISSSITCLPNLVELYLTGNNIGRITKLPPSLTRFDIARNSVAQYENQELLLLQKYHISRNSFTEIPFGITLRDCNSFMADHNQIHHFTFDRTKFDQSYLNSITSIDISFNRIDSIPIGVFQDLIGLQTFNANYNNISEIPADIIYCKSLTKLFVSHNPIKQLPQLPSNLEQLFAANCDIDSVDNVFSNAIDVETNYDVNSKIKTVVLSCNNLTDFPSLPDIYQLYLSCNKLTQLPQITRNMSVLDVSMNKITDFGMPQELSGPSLLCFDISYNQITKIPAIQKPNMLTRLNFAGNLIQGSNLNVSQATFLDSLNISQTGITNVQYHNLRELIASSEDIHLNSIIHRNNDPLSHESMCSCRRLNYVFKNRKKGNLIVRGCFSEIQGWRASMEDSIIVRDDLGLYAVCDGHGGPWTAMFISDMFAILFEKYFPSTLQMCVMKMYKKNSKHRECPNNQVELFSQDEVHSTVMSIYNQVEQKLSEKKYADGSTLCLCFLYHVRNDDGTVQESIKNDVNIETNLHNLAKRKLLTAHLGDARALIMRTNGTSRTLTVDHKPFMRSEYERVHNEFGYLIGNRIDGVLAVSRSMGDRCVTSVGHQIEINEFDIDENDQYLIIGCDGVFDVLSNDEVANIAYNSYSPNDAAHQIRNAAFGVGSNDNISVIVVDLVNKHHEHHHHKPNQRGK